MLAAIWKLWPSLEPATPPPLTAAVLSPELEPWLEIPQVISEGPSGYRLELRLRRDFAASLGGARKVQLGFRFMGPGGVLAQGAVPWAFDPAHPVAELHLPNNTRVGARQIELHLAR